MTTRRTDLADRLRARGAVVADRYRRVRRHRATLRQRVRALEAEVQENRQLNRRIAELTDVVTELLVPLQDRDEARVREVLDGYRQSM